VYSIADLFPKQKEKSVFKHRPKDGGGNKNNTSSGSFKNKSTDKKEN
jgi:hypothetical protein